MNFIPPNHDNVRREVYLKGNLQVKRGDKLFVFGDTRAMHMIAGYYLQNRFVGMSVWPELRINQMYLIKENNVRAVEK